MKSGTKINIIKDNEIILSNGIVIRSTTVGIFVKSNEGSQWAEWFPLNRNGFKVVVTS